MREPDRPARRHRRLHAAAERARRHRGRPVRAAPRRRPLPARHRHRVRDARPRVAREEHAARRLRLRQRRHVRVRVSLPVGAERARASSSLDFPYMQAREISRRRRAGASPRGSRTSASSAGSCTARPSTGCALWDALRVDGVTPGGYRAIDALRLEKGYRAWASDLNARDDAVRGGARRSRSSATRASSSAATRSSREPAQRLVCLVLDDPRAIALGSEPVRAADGDDRRPRDERRLRLRGRREHRARVRPRRVHASRGRRWRSTSSATGSRPRCAPSRCTTRRASGCAHEIRADHGRRSRSRSPPADLAPGDRLPTERDLAADYGVSRMTVRQALQSLEARGVLRRTIGRNGGSFVAQPKLERDLGTFSGLSAAARTAGRRCRARACSRRARRGASIEIVRVRYADGEPFALERSSLSGGAVPGPARPRPDRVAVRAARRALRRGAGARGRSGSSRCSPTRRRRRRSA